MRRYSIEGMGCIAVPVLNDSTATGEKARISCFVDGAYTVLEFSQGIFPREDGFTLHNQLLNECYTRYLMQAVLPTEVILATSTTTIPREPGGGYI